MTVEHSLVNAYKIIQYLKSEPTTYEGVKVFFEKTYSHVFDIVDYSIWKGIILQVSIKLIDNRII
ncbi:hypothetical protein NQ314_016715 [Rhamnusium bicolor]|uniref:Uncharacterized protein n=1 Tax=Rhamnusium bicolor TaxID=1586634 RepID=A0AAV8WV11_9CUCU|nr:hypothetical protein NQ314_016715 [Rhamnusium bicolor]